MDINLASRVFFSMQIENLSVKIFACHTWIVGEWGRGGRNINKREIYFTIFYSSLQDKYLNSIQSFLDNVQRISFLFLLT